MKMLPSSLLLKIMLKVCELEFSCWKNWSLVLFWWALQCIYVHGESALTYVTVLQYVLLEFETNAEYIIPFPFCADHFLLKLNHRNNLSASHTRIQQSARAVLPLPPRCGKMNSDFNRCIVKANLHVSGRNFSVGFKFCPFPNNKLARF